MTHLAVTGRHVAPTLPVLDTSVPIHMSEQERLKHTLERQPHGRHSKLPCDLHNMHTAGDDVGYTTLHKDTEPRQLGTRQPPLLGLE